MKIVLGRSGKGNVNIDLGILLRTRLLVQADSGGGKSWLLRRLAEQMFGKVQIILIDPEGEFASLREKYGYVLVGKGGETPADPRSATLVAHKLLELRASAICDIYELKHHDRHRWVRLFLEAMINSPKSLWRPCVVIVDEAHCYCPEKGKGESEASGAMSDLCTRGRKRGFCAVFATQRLGQLSKDASSQLQNRLIGPTFEDINRKRAADVLGILKSDEREFFREIQILEPGRFYALGRAISTQRILVDVGKVETTHPEAGSSVYATTPPPPPEKIRALLPKLKDIPQQAEERALTIAELKHELSSLRTENTRLKKYESVKAEPTAKTVKVSALSEAQVKRAEVTACRLEKVSERTLAAIREIAEAVKQSKMPAGVSVGIRMGMHALPRLKPTLVPEPPRSASHVEAGTGTNNVLSKGGRAILKVVAQYPEGATREQITVMTGYKRSTRDAYLQRLGQAGYIEVQGGKVVASQQGLQTLGSDYEPLPTGEALRLYWLGNLSGGQREILRVLIEAYPQSISRDTLTESTGMKRSTRDAYLQRLSARKLVVQEGRGSVKASDVLFEGS